MQANSFCFELTSIADRWGKGGGEGEGTKIKMARQELLLPFELYPFISGGVGV